MIPRCAFFFANPNMAAVLFVQLALVGRSVAARCPRTGAVLTGLASLAVVLTGSRGGFVALVAGLLVSAVGGRAARHGRTVPKGLCVLAALVLAGVVVLGGLGGRFCSIPRDGSVANRMILWRAVPRMMADAPDGWGLGRSGAAFVDWYQPLDRHEEYRTMVGSHQTLLVEFGRTGRILYVFGWLLLLTLAFRHARATGDSQAAAQGTALAVAATFSSVLESWPLWIFPALALVPVLRDASARRLGAVAWTGVLAGALVPVLSVMALCGSGDRRFESGGRVARPLGPDAVPSRWLVPDVRVLGAHGPRFLRAAGCRISVAEALGCVGSDAEELIVCGAAQRLPRDGFPRLRRITYLSPRFRPLACDPACERIVVGEFASDVPDPAPAGVTVIPGRADYLGGNALFASGLQQEPECGIIDGNRIGQKDDGRKDQF